MADSGSKKRLGRGLAALIGEMDEAPAAAREAGRPEQLRADRKVPIEQIRANPNNPRRQFAEENLADLARSIAEHGIVQPILVRPIKGEDLGGARYEIIAGERRWRAAQKAALHEIPVILREVEDKEALELAIIENVQRADLNPVEEALGYQQLIDEYDYTQADLGNVIGKSRSHVANTLRLLKLPDAVQTLLSSDELSAGHARALVTSDDPVGLAKRIVRDGLSVRQAEALTQKPETGGKPPRKLETKSLDFKAADIKELERQIEERLGLKADIRLGKGEKGELRIRYKTLDQFESLCQRLLS